jgi:hypothetical protein
MTSIDEAKDLQKRLGLGHIHIAYLTDAEFFMAHPDWERESGEDLYDCWVHYWLTDHEPGKLPTGWFKVLLNDSGYYELQGLENK